MNAVFQQEKNKAHTHYRGTAGNDREMHALHRDDLTNATGLAFAVQLTQEKQRTRAQLEEKFSGVLDKELSSQVAHWTPNAPHRTHSQSIAEDCYKVQVTSAS